MFQNFIVIVALALCASLQCKSVRANDYASNGYCEMRAVRDTKYFNGLQQKQVFKKNSTLEIVSIERLSDGSTILTQLHGNNYNARDFRYKGNCRLPDDTYYALHGRPGAKAQEQHLQGNSISGYVPSQWTTQTLACGKATDEFIPAYRSCIDIAIKEIVPFSDDPSDVVADAVLGRCEPLKATYIVRLTPCMGPDKADLRRQTSSSKHDLRPWEISLCYVRKLRKCKKRGRRSRHPLLRRQVGTTFRVTVQPN